MKKSQNDIPPCLITIDKDGCWFHKGVEMIHRDFIRLFYQHMRIDSFGRYVIDLDGDRCQVEVEDAPFVVRRVTFKEAEGTNNSRFILFLSDDSRENLSPATLRLGADNVLYCKVKNRTFPARFNRSAYYQLAEYVEEGNGEFFLRLNGKKHVIHSLPGEGVKDRH